MSLHLLFDAFCKRRLQIWMLAAILGMTTGSALGQEGRGVLGQPEIAARSAVLMNPATGEILFAKEPHLRLPPASTTKVLTALVTLERLDPNARILVSPQAAGAPPSRIGLRAGESALAQDLLYGLLLKSGNDAAETLAEGAGGSIYGFAELMNARAEQIGARDSHFMNPHGLPNDDHYTTAYDLALIFRQAMSHPMFADIVRTRSAALRIESGNGPYDDWRMVPVQSHNRLLASYEGTLGGKTGFTLKARRCFVGEVDRGGVRLIVSILNSPSSGTLWQDARTLLDYGFSRYGLAPPLPAQQESRPTWVRRAPIAEPDDDDDDRVVADRPAVERRNPAVTKIAAVRTAVAPVKPAVVPARIQKIAKADTVIRTAAVAKPAASKNGKSPVVAAAKPSVGRTTAKAGKPNLVVAAAKPTVGKAASKQDKREATKVAAVRTESAGAKQPQKIAKRRT